MNFITRLPGPLLVFFGATSLSFGSPILIIGTLKLHHFFEAANLIIKSGPIPAGSPGE